MVQREPILDRDLSVNKAPDKSETSYHSQIYTQSQKPINDPITQEEPMDSKDSDVSNLIDVPEEILFQDYLLAPWYLNALRQC